MTHNQNYRNVLWDPMPKRIFQELQTIDTEIAWELCRADVISRLAGLDAFAVPFLDEAKVFEPFAVIGKAGLAPKPLRPGATWKFHRASESILRTVTPRQTTKDPTRHWSR